MDTAQEFQVPKVVLYGVGTAVGLGGLVAFVGATLAWKLWDSLRRNGW